MKRSTIAIAHKVEEIREKMTASAKDNELNDQKKNDAHRISKTGLEIANWKSSMLNQLIACFST